MKRIAFYGGSFDPVHRGHLTIARELTGLFNLDRFVFVPAFHAPHKKDKRPTSAFHRYAMLALATKDEAEIEVSKMELELPERPYTVETLARLKKELPIGTQIFFVMGADSWAEITTWREWETVLTLARIIVVTRPDYPISFSHVTEEIKKRVVDLRAGGEKETTHDEPKIYITDAVFLDVSASEIRQKIKERIGDWRAEVSPEVAKYVEKYELYV